MNEGALSTFNKTKNYIVGLVIASFNESLSHFSDLEKNFVGQRVVPSPAKNMPPKTKPSKKAGTNPKIHPKIAPAPRDRAPLKSVHYPQINEGGLNKYAKSEKDKRNEEALDNLDIALKSRFISDSKETTDVMGLKIEAEHLIWILDSDKELAGIIAAISQSLEQLETRSASLQWCDQK